ncbi:MAG: glycosyltransferase family 4 protein [Methylotenera sp.]|nr:glycosyltransferase family 4 protein [Methylotenera sp.]
MPIKITFVLPPVGMSGGIKVLALYAKALVEKGHEVFLISPPYPSKFFRRKIKDFLLGRGWPKISHIASHLDGLGLNHHTLSRYRPVVDSDVPDADIVVATWWETAEWVAKLNPAKGKKCYFIQGYEIFDFLPVERCKASYRLPLHKIVVAKWLADVMRSEYGDDHVDIVPNSVDRNQFYAPVRHKQLLPTIGFLYSSTALKGVDVTLKVIDRLKLVIPKLRVISFGAISPNDNVLIDRGIEFYHSPAQDKIRDLYAQCDVWITASRTEGFNLPAMEAMACRTPVVSTKTGWPAEAIVNGMNGFLTEIDDVDELTVVVTQVLLATNEAWKMLSENAFNTVQNCSWHASCQMFEFALMKVANQD